MATQLNAQIDKLLTQASSGYFPDGYVSESALPMIGVVQTTGKLGKYGSNHLIIENSVKAGKGKYRRIETQSRSSATYSIEGHGLEGLVAEEDYYNVDAPFDAEKDEVMGISTMLWLEKEKVLADALSDTAVITQNQDFTSAATSQFNDYGNSDPISVFNTAKTTVRSGCGAVADTAIMDYYVAEFLRYHPQMLDALGFKYDRPGGLNYAELASAIGVKRVLVPNVMYNSANAGQTASLAAVWGKHIILGVFPDKAVVRQVSVGYMMRYSRKAPRQVSKWSLNNPPGSTAVLVEDCYQMLISNAAAAYLIKGAVA